MAGRGPRAKKRTKSQRHRKHRADCCTTGVGQQIGHCKVVLTDDAGRGCIASKDFGAGEIVFEDTPYVVVVRRQFALRACARCLEWLPSDKHTSSEQACLHSVAQEAALRFKGEATETLARLLCDGFRYCAGCLQHPESETRCRFLTMFCIILGIRHGLVLNSSTNDDKYTGIISLDEALLLALAQYCSQPNNEQIDTLQTHQEGVDKALLDVLKATQCDFARVFSLKENKSVVRFVLQMNVNAHGMMPRAPLDAENYDMPRNVDVAVGLFPFVPLLNHSCAPNAVFQNTGGRKMQVRTVRHVSTGTPVCVSYIDTARRKRTRQKDLKQTKFFNCHCERCRLSFSHADLSFVPPKKSFNETSSDTVRACLRSADACLSSVRCPHCSASMLPPSPQRKPVCPTCRKKIDTKKILSDITLAEQLVDQGERYYAMRQLQASIDTFEAVMARTCLDPLHELSIAASARLVNLYAAADRKTDELRAALHLMHALRRVHAPCASAEVALFAEHALSLLDKVSADDPVRAECEAVRAEWETRN
ncbi:MAG: hypothetical protein MHM6MM_000417 [Cercozoa sp. M6MM]